MTIFTFLLFAKNTMAMDVKATWELDIEASINRCVRFGLSACRTPKKTTAHKEQLNNAFGKDGFVLIFDDSKVKMGSKENLKQGSYKITQSTYSYMVIETSSDSSGKKRTSTLVREELDLICFAEETANSECMCFRKK